MKNRSLRYDINRPTIMDITFWGFLILDLNFPSPQVKPSVIISNKHGIYELPEKLLNDLKLRNLGSYESLQKSLNFIEL